MTTREAWLTTIVLVLALLLAIGTVELVADAIAPGEQRFEKAWCKEPGGTLEACAVIGEAWTVAPTD